MSIYRLKEEQSKLDEVRFVTTENGSIRAYLHARGDSPKEELQGFIFNLREEGLETVPFSHDGQHYLEVRAFDTEKQLIHTLEKIHAISGTPEIEKDQKSDISFADMVKKRTLQASGVAYLVGDLAYTYYGYKESHWEDVLAGIFYFAGTGSLLAYGRNDQSDLQLREFSKKMEDFFENKFHHLPNACSVKDIADDKERTAGQRLNDFLRAHPAEMMNTLYGMAGLAIARSAYKYHVKGTPKADMDAQSIKDMRTQGWLDIGLGSMTATSGAISTLVKEKKPDPDDPPAQGFEAFKQKLQEKPLMIAGIGYMVSTLMHAGSTFLAYKDAKKRGDLERLSSTPWRATFVGANLIAETLLAMSSKGHGDGVVSDESVKDSMYNLSAELIAAQPKDEHEQHIQIMAGFLEQPEVLAESRVEVERQLRNRIAALENNPWACCDHPNDLKHEHLPNGGLEVVDHSPGDPARHAKAHTHKDKVPDTLVAAHSTKRLTPSPDHNLSV